MYQFKLIWFYWLFICRFPFLPTTELIKSRINGVCKCVFRVLLQRLLVVTNIALLIIDISTAQRMVGQTIVLVSSDFCWYSSACSLLGSTKKYYVIIRCAFVIYYFCSKFEYLYINLFRNTLSAELFKILSELLRNLKFTVKQKYIYLSLHGMANNIFWILGCQCC